MDGRTTDGQTYDGRTDGQTDGLTDNFIQFQSKSNFHCDNYQTDVPISNDSMILEVILQFNGFITLFKEVPLFMLHCITLQLH